jgi:predicted metal-binding membrane protein
MSTVPANRRQATRLPSAALVQAATVALAAGCWIVSVPHMSGMDMGPATRLGSFPSFVALWAAMMAAMMLPGAAPAVVGHARAGGRLRGALLFVGSYLAVWTFAGVPVYALYRPHGTAAAGALTAAAGVYELTPLKQRFRRRCRASVRSGFAFGRCCVGSSIGLMVVLLALGAMSLTWMAFVTVLVVAQKLLPPARAVDLPLAFAFIALGVLIVLTPAAIPGLTPTM